MTAYYTVFISLVFWKSSLSAPCIPANTCFPQHFDQSEPTSRKWTCDASGTVKEYTFVDTLDCAGESAFDRTLTHNGASGVDNTNAGDLDNFGDEVVGSSTGRYKTDYLQGTNCPVLSDPSNQCTTYMVLKHRGTRNRGGDLKPYLDIGDNCTNYISSPGTFVQYDQFFVPLGCVDEYIGSNNYYCNDNEWGYDHYPQRGCGGGVESAQSDSFVVDKCGYTPELTRSDFGNQPAWWHWYDLVCCGSSTDSSKPCVGSPEPSPTANGPGPTPQPVTAPSPTPQPASQPVSNPIATPQPAAGPVATPQPAAGPVSTPQPAAGPVSTPQPATQPSATGSSPTTKAPTSPGTARPTAPTTAAPTNSDGNTAPTPPTTASPTSPGTAKPTTADSAAKVSMMLVLLYAVLIMLNM